MLLTLQGKKKHLPGFCFSADCLFSEWSSLKVKHFLCKFVILYCTCSLFFTFLPSLQMTRNTVYKSLSSSLNKRKGIHNSVMLLLKSVLAVVALTRHLSLGCFISLHKRLSLSNYTVAKKTVNWDTECLSWTEYTNIVSIARPCLCHIWLSMINSVLALWLITNMLSQVLTGAVVRIMPPS